MYKFEIPEEVADWILETKSIQPSTYIQNELVNPIIKDYEKSISKAKIEVAKAETELIVSEAKKKMRLINSEAEEKR